MNGFEFDLVGFLSAGKENAGAVIFLVLVLTFVAGIFGAKGKVQLGIALVMGAVIGAAFQIASVGVPEVFAGWFWLVVYALLMGVLPVLFYEFGKETVAKVLARSAIPAETAEKVGEALGDRPVGRD